MSETMRVMKTEDMNTAIRLLELENKLSGSMAVKMTYEREDNGTEITDFSELVDGTRIKNILSRTWQEIWDAAQGGTVVYLYTDDDNTITVDFLEAIAKPGADIEGNIASNYAIRSNGFPLFECDNPAGYPYFVSEYYKPYS